MKNLKEIRLENGLQKWGGSSPTETLDNFTESFNKGLEELDDLKEVATKEDIQQLQDIHDKYKNKLSANKESMMK